MTWPLRYNTSGQVVPLGPFVDYDDDAGALVPAESLTIDASDIRLHKSGTTTEVAKNSGGATHIAAGRYRCTLDASDTDTLGPLRIAVSVAGALGEWIDCCVLPAAVYDALHLGSGDGVRALATNTVDPPTAAVVAGQVRTELATELGRLDVPISSRSTLTAAQVWAAATRTLTAAADSAGVMTLLSRITGLLRTKAEADATDSTLLSALEGVQEAIDDLQADVDDLQSRPEPPTAEVISAQVADDLATAHGAGSWQTATGFATPADVSPTIEFAPTIEPTELSAASAEAITNPILVAIGQIEGGGGGMTASGVRAAIGMAAANLDTQLAAILSSSGTGGSGGGGALALGAAHVVERSTHDEQPIRFPWTVSEAPIAVRRSINGGAYESAAGAAAYHRTESGVHWYSLAFNAADRPSTDGEPSEGTVRYELYDGSRKRYMNLRVYSAVVDTGGAGTGDRRLPIRAQLAADATTGVPGVRLRVAGSTVQNTTGTAGDTYLDLDPGEHLLDVIEPAGYQAVGSIVATVPAEGEVPPLIIPMVATTVTPPDSAAICRVTLRVADEADQPWVGVPVTTRLVSGPVVGATLHGDRFTPETTDEHGLVTLDRIRGQAYEFTATKPDGTKITIRRRLPDLPNADLSMTIPMGLG